MKIRKINTEKSYALIASFEKRQKEKKK